MAVKTKPKSVVDHKNIKLSLLFALICIVICLVYYIWTKTCEIIFESKQTDSHTQGWALTSLFSSEKDTGAETSVFLEREFYIKLLLTIQNDISTLSNAIYNFILNNCLTFLGSASAMVVCTTALLTLLVSWSINFYFNKNKPDAKKQKKRKYEKTDKSTSENHITGSGNSNKDSLTSSSRYNRRFYWKWLTGLLFVAFLFSIPWEFVRLYQSMVAEKVSHMAKGTPAECIPDMMSVSQNLKSWFRWQFSWTNDPCLQYHKALLVDPIWEVPPLMVISSAFSRCLVYPIEIFFGALGRAFRLFFSEIPSQWQPLMFFATLIMCMFVLIMVFGYRLHLPFLIKFEPKTPVYLKTKSRTKLDKSEDTKKDLNLSLESSQESQDTVCTQDTQFSQYSLDSQSY